MFGWMQRIGRVMLGACVIVGSLQSQAKAYRVRHDYTIQLNQNGVIRGAWKYKVDTRAKSRGAPWDRDRDTGVVQPIFAPFAQMESENSSSGNTATAVANSQITFNPAGGFHQVDGDANIANNGQFARSYAKSIAAFNVGVRRPNGRIRWSPRWQVDRISRSKTVARDPVDLTLTDLDTGLTRTARVFDVQTDMSGKGSSSWENGRLRLEGFDGSFSLNMESPFLTSPGGRMSMAFDALGVVTHSEDTGIFDGLLPAVGQAAVLDMQIGNANGEIDLDFDFSQTGDVFGENLDLSGELGGDGVVIRTGNPATTAQDFSTMPNTIGHVLHGTGWQPAGLGPGPGATLLPDDQGDVFDGFLRLTHDQPGEQNTVAFDNTSPGRFDRVEATFDFRMINHGIEGQGAGMSFSLLPTTIYGEAGQLPQPDLGAEPNLFGALGIGLDTLNNPEDNCQECVDQRANHVSLHFDGQQVGQSRLVDPLGELDLTNGQWNTAVLEMQDVGEGALVSLTLIDGEDGSEHHVYQQEFVPGVPFESMRAALAADSNDAFAAHDVDNLIVDFSCSLCSDFDGDLDVDQMDLAIWRGEYGVDGFADSDGDGDSDGQDFLQLQQQYTGDGFQVVSASAVASVPEPATLVLMLVSMSVGVLGRQKEA